MLISVLVEMPKVTVISNRRLKLFAEFHDLEMDTMMKALQALEAIEKCRIIMGEGDEALVSQIILQRHVLSNLPLRGSICNFLTAFECILHATKQGVKFAN